MVHAAFTCSLCLCSPGPKEPPIGALESAPLLAPMLGDYTSHVEWIRQVKCFAA